MAARTKQLQSNGTKTMKSSALVGASTFSKLRTDDEKMNMNQYGSDTMAVEDVENRRRSRTAHLIALRPW